MSQSAARLLNVSAEMVKGQAINSVAGGVLHALGLRRDATRTMTIFEISTGHTLVATTRPLMGSNAQFLGWVVALHHDLASALNEFQAQQTSAMTTITTIQQQLKNMQELVAMLPRFSHHPYWQYLLIEHMERLTGQLDSSVQHLVLLEVQDQVSW